MSPHCPAPSQLNIYSHHLSITHVAYSHTLNISYLVHYYRLIVTDFVYFTNPIGLRSLKPTIFSPDWPAPGGVLFVLWPSAPAGVPTAALNRLDWQRCGLGTVHAIVESGPSGTPAEYHIDSGGSGSGSRGRRSSSSSRKSSSSRLASLASTILYTIPFTTLAATAAAHNITRYYSYNHSFNTYGNGYYSYPRCPAPAPPLPPPPTTCRPLSKIPIPPHPRRTRSQAIIQFRRSFLECPCRSQGQTTSATATAAVATTTIAPAYPKTPKTTKDNNYRLVQLKRP